MNHPFILNQSYNRLDLLSFVGSKQTQSGIIWGTQQPTVVICTSGGRNGVRAGYDEDANQDGSLEYLGQGEKGDQDPAAFANRLLIEGQRSVLFFKTREPTALEVRAAGNWKKRYTFLGEFCTASWDFIEPTEGRRKGSRLIKFILMPVREVAEANETQTVLDVSTSENQLRKALKARVTELGTVPQKGIQAKRDYYLRSNLLRKYVKLRASGFCEYCGKEAPFTTEENEPYLETHHIFRLADDGPDAVENVVGLCPNCHRNAHHGKDRLQLQAILSESIKQKEST